MKVNFRQGIVSSYAAGLTPLFLAPSSIAGFVDLVVSPEPTVVSFAHGGSDYLQVFNADVTAAWGPVASGQDNFLYWEIDQLTANVLFKITRYPLLTTSTAPVSPPVDQHWFDLATTTMKYWTGTKWLPKIAVFAGSVPSGSMSLLQPYGYGSQVGVNTPADPGFVMLSSLLKPIYTNPATFEFLTTTKSVRIKTTAGTSGVLATPPNAFIPVRASENIPAFSLVYFSGEDTVGLASSNPALTTPRIPIGIVQVDLSANEMGNVTQNGEVQWDQWDWSAHIGQPLYCTSNGQITTVRPSGLMAYRVGFVKNKDTILFNVDAETMPQIYQAMPNDIIVNGVAPLSSTFSTNGIGERIWTVEISDATTSQRGAMTAAQATLLDTHTTQIADNTADILTKAPIVHTHVINDVADLQTELDGKSPVGHNHDLLYSPLSHNHDAQYSALGHAHIIGDVTGLQNALNLKADITHSHVIGDVTGLQPALDDKFTTATDFLPMAQVTGLASALALKSPVGHGHVIADVSNLQTSLDAKISFTNTTVYTPTSDYNPATKKYVDDAAVPFGSINQHTDVDTATVAPAVDDVLKWNGTNWVPGVDVAGGASGLSTVIVPLGAPLGTFVFRSLVSEFTYMSAYSTYLAGYTSDWEGNFDQSSIAAGTTFPSAKIVDLSGVLGPRASVLGDTEQVAPEEICEFEFIGTPEMGKYFFVGWFQEAFGPAFSPTAEYGGPLTSWYHSSPSTAAIYGYGGVGSQSDLTPWQTGDVLGVIYGGPGNGITFFRNGVLVGSVGRVNTGGFPMCGYAVLS